MKPFFLLFIKKDRVSVSTRNEKINALAFHFEKVPNRRFAAFNLVLSIAETFLEIRLGKMRFLLSLTLIISCTLSKGK